ncbi:hypothetical protein OG206_07200 [Streptomyces sp. NBC_01341]|uniref:hypothetical protein n=1 Tax=Streptomyces sp. NBC_01341 TaxID=2903831 RepID=UPI002E10FE4A|nr:hypothetical protein OG206_07200 [Streptomyces sp. NBC_01341]
MNTTTRPPLLTGTYDFASLQDARLPALTGPGTLHGPRGATAAGDTGGIRHRWVTSHEAPASLS